MRVAPIPDEYRRTGETTRQMKAAPNGAIYVWPVSSSLSYAKDLARHLGREDLEIVGPSVFLDGGVRLRGRRLSGLVLDHACDPSAEELDVIDVVREFCVR